MLVLLVGFMGAGKTSVGHALSDRLGWRFEDLDDRIEAREQRSIQQIFAEAGETGFRQAETAALSELLAGSQAMPGIVALGGGAFAQRDNTELIENAGATVIFLDATAEELFRRCGQEARVRPLRHGLQEFRELYDRRRPAYLKASHRIDTQGKSVKQVAREVACCLGVGK